MALPPGTRIGVFELTGLIGAGGMGEVYRARDVRLGRDVAIKVLPARTARDPQAIARFEQESRAVAALSHPNILAIHDVGVEGDTAYAVMELLEGQTLRDLMSTLPAGARGALPLRKAADIASQMASGLAAAHARGITHRDIKPENVFVTSDGHVKILDFGLAKIDEPAAAQVGETRTVVRTDAGTVLGTSGYLSPEQAQGQVVDFRSDIFSFGTVLYEMVTGTRAFKGDSVIDTLHQIVHGAPEPAAAARPQVPAELDWVIAKCLAKDPDERYQSTRDLVIDLRKVGRAVESSASLAALPAAALPAVRSAAPWMMIVAGVLIVGAAAGAWWRFGRPAGAGEDASLATPLSIERITSLGTVIDAVISPDGKYVAYVVSENARQGLWIRQLATSSTLQLVPPGPFGFWGAGFSNDGSQVYYGMFAPDDPTRSIYRIPALGGTPRKVVTGIDSQPVFSPDGRRMAFMRGGFPEPGASSLMVADVDGGNLKALATRRAPEFFVPIFFTAPAWSPDGSIIVVPMERREGKTVGTFIAVNATDGTPAPFPRHEFPTVGQAAWLPDGSGLIAVAGDSPALGQRVSRLWWISARDGAQRRITHDLQDYRTVSLTADSSVLVTVATEANGSIWTAPVDGSGDAQRISTGRYDGLNGLRTVRDGRVLYRSLESGATNIWIMDANGSAQRQVTTDGVAAWPSPMPDSRSLLFVKTGVRGLWQSALDGTGEHQIPGPTTTLDPTVTPDGKWIFYVSNDTGEPRLWKIAAEGGTPMPVVETFSTRPSISPDGTKLAFYYQKSRDSDMDLVVMPLDGHTPTSRFDVAPSTGFSTVRWTADGKALVHNTGVGDRANIWLQPIAGGAPRKVTHFADQIIFGFDVSADGKSLVISRGVLSRDAVLIRQFQ